MNRLFCLPLLSCALISSATCQQRVPSNPQQVYSQINNSELSIVLKLGEMQKPKNPSSAPQTVSTVTEFSVKGAPIELQSNAVVKRGNNLTITTKEYGTLRVVVSAGGEAEIWGTAAQKQKLTDFAKSFDLPLSGQTSDSVQTCRSILGGRVSAETEATSRIENCARATLSHHDRISGDFLGIILRVPPGTAPFDLSPDNTFLEYSSGDTNKGWIAWFPDRTNTETVKVLNGTSIGVKIDMPGIGSGEAIGVSQGSLLSIGMGYGTMLFHDGVGDITWNLAYADAGVGHNAAALTIDVTKAPGTSRLLLLFRKSDSKISKVHFAGNTYTIQP